MPMLVQSGHSRTATNRQFSAFPKADQHMILFWSAKRLLPVYGLLLIGLPVVWAMMWLLGYFHAPIWTVSTAFIVWAVTWIGAGIRAAILQIRDNAAPPPDWLTGKPRNRKGVNHQFSAFPCAEVFEVPESRPAAVRRGSCRGRNRPISDSPLIGLEVDLDADRMR